jgi:hypothetical protein
LAPPRARPIVADKGLAEQDRPGGEVVGPA